MSDDEVCEVIITADNADWLADFTRSLVEDRLAACGQNIASIRSIYRWEGKVQDEPEARVALHTRTSLVPEIVERADRDHPYDIPCVIALPVAGGNPTYINWVMAETERSASPQPARLTGLDTPR
jgi:periplasmic divalent cation tolerance protein